MSSVSLGRNGEQRTGAQLKATTATCLAAEVGPAGVDAIRVPTIRKSSC
jgi:hypothetical protein